MIQSELVWSTVWDTATNFDTQTHTKEDWFPQRELLKLGSNTGFDSVFRVLLDRSELGKTTTTQQFFPYWDGSTALSRRSKTVHSCGNKSSAASFLTVPAICSGSEADLVEKQRLQFPHFLSRACQPEKLAKAKGVREGQWAERLKAVRFKLPELTMNLHWFVRTCVHLSCSSKFLSLSALYETVISFVSSVSPTIWLWWIAMASSIVGKE